jgi:hypothetical protein
MKTPFIASGKLQQIFVFQVFSEVMFTTDALQNNHHIVSYDRPHFHYTTNL